jgi:hypothetical protein
MDDVERELVRAEVDALEKELAEERFRHVAGLEPAPALEPLFRARPRAAHRATVASLRERGDLALAERVAALRAQRAAASEEEAWRAAESGATGPGPDGEVPLAVAELAVTREAERGRRLAFGRAAAEAIRGAAAHREAAAEQRARARAEVGLTPAWEDVVQGDEVLRASGDAWAEVLEWSARRQGLAPAPAGDLERADLLWLLSARAHDGHFRPGMLPLELARALGGIGLDPSRVRVDDDERPGKWPGAHALESRVSFRRQGGAADWLGMFRAVGTAAAAATAPAARDPAFPAAAGWLAASLLLEPRFLERAAGVARSQAADVVRALALRRLFELRARAAALRIAAEAERGLSGSSWRRAHREALSAAARASWPDGLAARDADAQAHRDALAGAAWGERLRGELVERFDEDYWRNPRTAAWMAGLVAAGRAGPEKERPPTASAAGALVRRMEGRA